jgi:hypothetical protein
MIIVDEDWLQTIDAILLVLKFLITVLLETSSLVDVLRAFYSIFAFFSSSTSSLMMVFGPDLNRA